MSKVSCKNNTMRSHSSVPVIVQLTSKLVLGCNQPHVECVPEALYLHIKLAEHESEHLVPSSGQVKNE